MLLDARRYSSPVNAVACTAKPRQHGKVKSPISRYAERELDGRPDSSKVVTSTTSALLPPPLPQPALPATTDRENTGNRMARVLTILQAEPERLWRPREIAVLLVATLPAGSREEGGRIKRVRTGRYAAITQIPNPLRDHRKRSLPGPGGTSSWQTSKPPPTDELQPRLPPTTSN